MLENTSSGGLSTGGSVPAANPTPTPAPSPTPSPAPDAAGGAPAFNPTALANFQPTWAQPQGQPTGQTPDAAQLQALIQQYGGVENIKKAHEFYNGYSGQQFNAQQFADHLYQQGQDKYAQLAQELYNDYYTTNRQQVLEYIFKNDRDALLQTMNLDKQSWEDFSAYKNSPEYQAKRADPAVKALQQELAQIKEAQTAQLQAQRQMQIAQTMEQYDTQVMQPVTDIINNQMKLPQTPEYDMARLAITAMTQKLFGIDDAASAAFNKAVKALQGGDTNTAYGVQPTIVSHVRTAATQAAQYIGNLIAAEAELKALKAQMGDAYKQPGSGFAIVGQQTAVGASPQPGMPGAPGDIRSNIAAITSAAKLRLG